MSFFPATFWHDPAQSASQTLRRLQTPLHYHLRRHDFVAFQKELQSGSNPFMRDECGRTPLDLALMMVEDVIVSSLCTSFPVDFLVRTFEYDAKFPAKFVPRYAVTYANLYDHPNALRTGQLDAWETLGLPCSEDGVIRREATARFHPVRMPHPQHDTLPSHAYDHLKFAKDKRKTTDEGRTHFRPMESSSSSNGPDDDSDGGEESPFALASGSKLERLFQNQMLVVVEDAVQRPTPSRIKKRIHEILQLLEALGRAVTLLSTCEPLRVLAVEYRLSIARASPATSEPIPFVLSEITFPYLFMATLQTLYEMFPRSPSGSLWEKRSVADARRLMNVVRFKKLRGHEILQFLSELPPHMVRYIRTFGVQFFRLDPQLAQHLLVYAFCVGSVELFTFTAAHGQPFAHEDLFDWDRLIAELLPYEKQFRHFLVPLVTEKLRARIQGRFENDDFSSRGKICTPFEERFLTRDFLADFATLYGSDDLMALQNLLRWWQYEVVRMENGEPLTSFVGAPVALAAGENIPIPRARIGVEESASAHGFPPRAKRLAA